MAQTYLGLIRVAAGSPTPADIDAARARGSNLPPELGEKVLNLPANLPATCTLVASYTVGTPDLVSVMVVEAEGNEDLTVISDYYAGWLQIEWHPTTLVARA